MYTVPFGVRAVHRRFNKRMASTYYGCIFLPNAIDDKDTFIKAELKLTHSKMEPVSYPNNSDEAGVLDRIPSHSRASSSFGHLVKVYIMTRFLTI
jgi:hypothetical protein